MGYNNYFMTLLKEADIDIDIYCRDLLRGLLAIRDIRYKELWDRIGGNEAASRATVEDYCANGKIRNARGFVVCRIAKELDIDPFCLIGEKSIMEIWNKEDRALKHAMTGEKVISDSRIEPLRKYTRIIMDADKKHDTLSTIDVDELLKLYRKSEAEDKRRREYMEKKLSKKGKRK